MMKPTALLEKGLLFNPLSFVFLVELFFGSVLEVFLVGFSFHFLWEVFAMF